MINSFAFVQWSWIALKKNARARCARTSPNWQCCARECRAITTRKAINKISLKRRKAVPFNIIYVILYSKWEDKRRSKPRVAWRRVVPLFLWGRRPTPGFYYFLSAWKEQPLERKLCRLCRHATRGSYMPYIPRYFHFRSTRIWEILREKLIRILASGSMEEAGVWQRKCTGL